MREIYVTERKYTCPIATKKSYMAFVPAVLVAVGIAVLSLWENPVLAPQLTMSDKVLHGLMYSLLSAATMGGCVLIRRTQIRTYVRVVLAATLYGILLELLQHFCTVSRTGELADVYADCLGAIIGVLLIAFLYYSWRQLRSKPKKS